MTKKKTSRKKISMGSAVALLIVAALFVPIEDIGQCVHLAPTKNDVLSKTMRQQIC